MLAIRIIFICALFFPLANCVAQQLFPDTAFLLSAKNKSIAIYTASIKNQSRLYNGSDYIMYISNDGEHPYFMLDDWKTGSIMYWGERYDSIPLLYDLSTDQIITEHNRGNPLNLVQEKVQRFMLFNHTFVRIYGDDKNKMQEGFYDLLYDGSAKLYAKRSKTYAENLETRVVIPRFDEHTRYFILKEGIYKNVKSKSGALQIYADHKQDIKSFIRKNKIGFKKNKEKALIRIAEYYDTLK